jgi:hypothetical protein
LGLPLGEDGLLAGCLLAKEGVCGKDVRRDESEEGEREAKGREREAKGGQT